MRPLLLALLALSACATASATPRRCVTTCGLVSNQGNCFGLQLLESRVLKTFDRYVDNWTQAQVCSALAGWEIRIHKRTPEDDGCGTRGWMLHPHFCVAGFTNVERKQIELPDTLWTSGALSHELVHVVDLKLYGVAGHCRWGERGVNHALQTITGVDNPGQPERTCPDYPRIGSGLDGGFSY